MIEGATAFKTAALGLSAVLLIGSVAHGQAGNHDHATPAAPASGSLVPQAAIIPSNFELGTALDEAEIPPSAAPDVVGAFRFICGAGQLLYDDPIMFPGQPGRSHLHQFYGNLDANAHSTFKSLRERGDGTCGSPAVNRSAYWMPEMLDGRGAVVQPDYVSIYYKRRPTSDPKCNPKKDSRAEGLCVDLPHGLRYIFGYDPTRTGKEKTGGGHWNCQGPTARPGTYPDLTEALKNCPPGNQLGAIISSPSCWDGKNLDSPDHRSHVAFASYGSWGYLKCPRSHPYVIAQFTLGAWYTIAPGDVTLKTVNGRQRAAWELSSDHMEPRQQPGYTFHADWWGAWDPAVLDMWHRGCIDRMLNCSAGDLGTGQRIKGVYHPSYGWTNPQRLVPAPPPRGL